MKSLLLLICFIWLGCAHVPPSPAPDFAGWYNNACLPEAAAMTEGLHRYGIKAQVLIINTTQYSHSVCVYMYPAGDNQLWCWDSNWKSVRLHAYWGDADGIASAWLERCRVKNETLVSAILL